MNREMEGRRMRRSWRKRKNGKEIERKQEGVEQKFVRNQEKQKEETEYGERKKPIDGRKH
jgi:hypothetical protein